MSGCGHEEIAPDCIFCGTDGMSAEDIIKGQEAFDLKMRKAKAWDELENWVERHKVDFNMFGGQKSHNALVDKMSELMK